jgi:hypothetical protein
MPQSGISLSVAGLLAARFALRILPRGSRRIIRGARRRHFARKTRHGCA